MNKKLLIVFAKNKIRGKVKTRLAATIGDAAALKVYERLLTITENATAELDHVDLRVYYSHEIDKTSWEGLREKYVQQGDTLGDRMLTAFQKGFRDGYNEIVGIGADLDTLTRQTILDAHRHLNSSDFVFGPAEDGGYYLIGLRGEKGSYVFKNKPWSTAELLNETLTEIHSKDHQYVLMDTRNDIDTIEDLQRSALADEFLNITSNEQK